MMNDCACLLGQIDLVNKTGGSVEELLAQVSVDVYLECLQTFQGSLFSHQKYGCCLDQQKNEQIHQMWGKHFFRSSCL